MRSFAGIAAVLLPSAFLAGFALASPGQSFYHREMLLGDNEDQYFYLLFTWTNPGGTYYDAVESLFVCQRSRRDAKQLTRTLVKASNLKIDSANLKKGYAERPVPSLDVFKLLADQRVHLPFFDIVWPESLAIDERGVCVYHSSVRSYFVGPEEVRAWTGTEFNGDDGMPHIHEVLLTSGEGTQGFHHYLIVRKGWGRDDVGQFEGIVPVSHEKMRAAIEDLARRRQRPAPGTLKR